MDFPGEDQSGDRSVGFVLRARIPFSGTLNFQGKSGGPINGFALCLVGFYRGHDNVD